MEADHGIHVEFALFVMVSGPSPSESSIMEIL
jgi:hypothetical protein